MVVKSYEQPDGRTEPGIASLVEASKKKNEYFMFCILFPHYNASVSRTLDSTSPGIYLAV